MRRAEPTPWVPRGAPTEGARGPVAERDAALLHEHEIVWLRPIEELPRYVREAYVPAESPYFVDPDELSARGVVGYAETSPVMRYLADSPRILRRIFWIKTCDPYEEGAPVDAVDPRTIRPGLRAAL
jgi:hypothetical protein